MIKADLQKDSTAAVFSSLVCSSSCPYSVRLFTKVEPGPKERRARYLLNVLWGRLGGIQLGGLDCFNSAIVVFDRLLYRGEVGYIKRSLPLVKRRDPIFPCRLSHD